MLDRKKYSKEYKLDAVSHLGISHTSTLARVYPTKYTAIKLSRWDILYSI